MAAGHAVRWLKGGVTFWVSGSRFWARNRSSGMGSWLGGPSTWMGDGGHGFERTPRFPNLNFFFFQFNSMHNQFKYLNACTYI